MQPEGTPDQEHLDVLVIGSGISGIDAGYHLQKRCPERKFAIFEARDSVGGTWDLFRFPGVRSDSDMHTLGFPFRPWPHEQVIVEGAHILEYLKQTAQEFGITRHIRLRHRVLSAHWCSDESRWIVHYENDGRKGKLTCNFLFMATGYYDYERGYLPNFPGIENFHGRIVHPQHWPEDLDYAGQRILVIGSGATAVTLVPAIAKEAAHVTMLQRSPSYIVALPVHDKISSRAFRLLPRALAGGVARWKNLGQTMFLYRLCRKKPDRTRRQILNAVRSQLPGFADVDRHFSPKYNPWDQRMCIAPDGDFFRAIRSGKVDIVTDTIRTFLPRGILLTSGREIDADIIVTATGLSLKMFGDIKLSVDRAPVDTGGLMVYRGMMAGGVPNLVLAFGYTNASWTLRVDLVARFFSRMLNHMKRTGSTEFRPQAPTSNMEHQPMLNLTSGYIARSSAQLPKQGSKNPWRVHQNYLLDLAALRFSSIEDGVLQFRSRASRRGHDAA